MALLPELQVNYYVNTVQRHYFYIYVYKLLDKQFLYTLSCRTYLPAEYSVCKFMYCSVFKLGRLEKHASSLLDIH